MVNKYQAADLLAEYANTYHLLDRLNQRDLLRGEDGQPINLHHMAMNLATQTQDERDCIEYILNKIHFFNVKQV